MISYQSSIVTMLRSCTVFEILSIICQNLKRSRDRHHAHMKLGGGGSSIQPFSHNKHGPKIFRRAEAGSPSNTESSGPRPSSIPIDILIHAAIWPRQIWTENWGLCPFGGGGAGSSSNTMWLGPRPTIMSSFIMIHLTVWPQCTNVRDRTDIDRQDRQTDRQTYIHRNTLNAILRTPPTAGEVIKYTIFA